MSQNDNVSGSIFSILAAYTNGLNIFKKLREQRVKGERKKNRTTKSTPKEDGRKKDPPTQSQTKAKVHHGAGHGDKRRKAENQLSKSLREGSRRIRREYDNGCEKAGSRFAIGDVIAKASLTETLINLNTGLVGIISSFLDNGKKEFNLELDKLITISDQARSETLIALSDLYQRLSTANLNLGGVIPGTEIKLSRPSQYQKTAERQAERNSQIDQKKPPRRTVRNGKKTPVKNITIARVPIKNSSTKQLAIVRPREHRQTSFSSSLSSNSRTSSGTAKTAFTTVTIPDLSMTKLRVSPEIHYQPDISDSSDSGLCYPLGKEIRVPNHDGQKRKPFKNSAERPNTKIPCNSKPGLTSAGKSRLAPDSKPLSQNFAETSNSISISPNEPLCPRRASITTPSCYSVVTDSTKIGEIPFNKQVEPPDLDLMKRLNSEAAESAYIYGQLANESSKPSARSRFLPKSWPWKRRRESSVAI